MTTELQAAAVELQQSEAKRAETTLVPDKVEDAAERLKVATTKDHWAAIGTLLSYIGSLEDENMRLRSAYLGGKVNTDIKLI